MTDPSGAPDQRSASAGAPVPPPLGRRTLSALLWNVGASPLRVVLLFVRMLVLMDLLAVATFGVFAKAVAITASTVLLAGFGMRAAFLNRVPETEDEERAAAVLFTLKLALTVTWTAAVIGGALLFASGDFRLALIVLSLTTAVGQIADMPRQVLQRRVVHRRVVAADLLAAGTSAVAAVMLALRGAELWSLLGGEIAAVATLLVVFFVWRPPWRPRFGWDPAIARYYLTFGGHNLPNALFMRAIDYVDDLWVGFALGDVALGVYSRAYRFATYPRTLIALPANAVAQGTFAELKAERERLSKAFFRITATLVRTGFLFVGALTLVSPEFVRLALDPKWLPMIQPFRLMLVYALIDPIRVLLAGLLTATGHPGKVLVAHAVQLAVLVACLPTLGIAYGIEGVAVGVNLMTVAGIGVLFYAARGMLDFSPRALWLAPTLALAAGLGAGAAAGMLATDAVAAWPSPTRVDAAVGALKLVGFGTGYAAVLLLLERRRMLRLLRLAWRHMGRGDSADEVR